MREMHKWKDKVEMSLDNRQIFFLFFGLSVVGCFVFALGVMVGRRVDWGTTNEVAALDEGEAGGLALLDPETAREHLSFKEGLAVPATDGLPQTRDPEALGAEDPSDAADASDVAETPADRDTALASGTAPSNPKKSSTAAARAPSSTAKLSGKFTLQMKAFATPEQAEVFANTLRANGHEVRVEAHEVKGRIWHRVRVGAFSTWNDGIAAKEAFEKNESVIAYVVRL